MYFKELKAKMCIPMHLSTWPLVSLSLYHLLTTGWCLTCQILSWSCPPPAPARVSARELWTICIDQQGMGQGLSFLAISTSAISLPLFHQRTLASLQYLSPLHRERGHVRLLKGGFVIYDYDETLFPQPWEAGCSWTRKIRPLTCIKAAHVVYIQLGCHKENAH